MGTIELTLEEVANKLNVSVKTVVTNWNKQRAKADALGIVKIGIGKNAKYICVDPTTKEQITYECLREYLIQECKFDIRTDFKKLIHYIYLVLLNTIDEEYHYNNLGYIQQLGISQRNLITCLRSHRSRIQGSQWFHTFTFCTHPDRSMEIPQCP